MVEQVVKALKASVITFVLCAVAYPAVVWGLAQLLFPFRAEGSLLYAGDGRTVIGSALIAQQFTADRYFHPRPSAVDYKADAAGGSNLGTNNPDLRKAIADRVTALGATLQRPAPVDLVTASGSGLDPEITVEAALYQAPRVAAARQMSFEQLRTVIEQHVDRSGALIGAPPRLNVLLLNLALDRPNE
jgi:potassium-transporting ATPase KdpC subunit